MGISNTVQQLSVFLENREGRLDEVLAALAKGGVNIVALSLADTSEYGMLRMIVSDPHKGRMVLKEEGITFPRLCTSLWRERSISSTCTPLPMEATRRQC